MLTDPTATNAEPQFQLWTVPVESFSRMNFDPFFTRGAIEASSYIEQLSENGLLTERHFTGNVVDFGCGYGGSTFVLAKNSAHVTAVDLSEHRIRRTLGYTGGIIESAVSTDGIAHLNQLPSSSVDLITAFMFGPDMEGQLSRAFYQAAQHALREEGRLLVVSDYETIGHLKNHVAENAGVFMVLDQPQHPLYIGGKAGAGNLLLPVQDAEILEHLEFFVPSIAKSVS